MKRFLVALLLAIIVVGLLFLLRYCGFTEDLKGVDANNDGIRDDLEQMIEERWAKDPKVRSAARFYAKTLQDSILHPDTTDQRTILFPVACLFYVAPGQAYEIGKTLEEMAANTYPRAQALIKESSRASGTILRRAKSRKEACYFDPSLQ